MFVHPGQPPLPIVAGVAGPLVDYPFDTTRTAVQLVLNGVVDRYRGARIILAHAGGFLPYASHRFAELARVFGPVVQSLRILSVSTVMGYVVRLCMMASGYTEGR